MMRISGRLIPTPLVAVAVAAAVVVPTASAQAAEVDLHARLHPSAAHPHASGGASYEADHQGREFEITVRGVAELAGKRLVVRVHGDLVGRMRVSAAGTAHLDREHGVPACSRGDAVRVRTGTGALVASGMLRPHHDD